METEKLLFIWLVVQLLFDFVLLVAGIIFVFRKYFRRNNSNSYLENVVDGLQTRIEIIENEYFNATLKKKRK